ncbi:MAG: DedA family protein, partial [Methylocella sp.]
QKHGGKIVFFGRFFAFLRVLAALLAGANKYRWPPFLFFNAAGGIVWALVFGIGAFVFGDSIHRVSGPLGVVGLGGIVAGAIAVMYIARRAERKMAKKVSRCDVDLHKLS